MSEEWALRQAVIASPEDDLPRLVYADWLDEAGDPGRAEFIRAQVQLAKTAPWEPFAVQAKYRRPELLAGTPWRQHLPRGEWHEAHFPAPSKYARPAAALPVARSEGSTERRPPPSSANLSI